MAWVKVSDDIHLNEKILSVSVDARWLYICLNAHSRNQSLGGHLPPGVVKSLVGSQGVKAKAVSELVTAGLLEADGPDFEIHDYDDYNPPTSNERVKKHRRKEREEAKSNEDVTLPKRPETTESPVTETPRNASRRRALGFPVPEPVPKVSNETYDPPTPQPGGEADSATRPESPPNGYEAFLAELNLATGRHFQGDQESRRLYRRQIQSGRTADDLAAAARGVGQSAHHMGQNESGMPYNAPVNVLRSKVFDQLIAAGRGEISLTPTRPNGNPNPTADEWGQLVSLGQSQPLAYPMLEDHRDG